MPKFGLRGGGKKRELILGKRHQRFRRFAGNVHLMHNFDPQERQDAMRERLKQLLEKRRDEEKKDEDEGAAKDLADSLQAVQSEEDFFSSSVAAPAWAPAGGDGEAAEEETEDGSSKLYFCLRSR
jgi:phage I-like protein